MSIPIKATTQEHLDILDITNNLVILKTGAAAMILKLNAINFNLLSDEEQEATIFTYAALLNSLSFPIEILIRSEKKDISDYVKLLLDQEFKELNPTIKSRITRYREFIEKLVKERNVLDKKFYVSIPFSELELGITTNTFNPLPQKPTTLPFEKSYIIQKALNTLEPKRDHLIRQFSHLGLSPKQLATQELIQLFYHIYNPEASVGTRMTSSSQYQSPIVQSSLPLPRQAQESSEADLRQAQTQSEPPPNDSPDPNQPTQ
jgi:hypothetical protein